MNIAYEVRQTLEDPLKSFRVLQRVIALTCILIPAILWIADRDTYFPIKLAGEGYKFKVINAELVMKDPGEFRRSLSDYVYSSNSYLFGLLYCMAAMLYIFNGVVYMNRQHTLKIHKRGNWYNVIIGLCLIGVVLHPQSYNELLHNLFSILFFAGNIIVMIFFPRPGETILFKKSRIAMGLLTLSIMVIGLIFFRSNLFWAEWISLTLIAGYLYLMTKSVELQ